MDLAVAAPARLAVQVAVADPGGRRASEAIDISLDGTPIPWTEMAVPHGGRLWLIDSPPGRCRIDYRADLEGVPPTRPAVLEDELLYLRPSRYCESDRLAGFALREFGGITNPFDLLTGVSSWVGTHLEYVPGSSGPTDGAVDTLLLSKGVCRDFAHLAIALLRALDIPARLAAVYAPGLKPMDFHAVAEACIDHTWYVIDSTLLAPRRSLVRIATGRDAADTAFVATYGPSVELDSMTVSAVTDRLPDDEPSEVIQLA